MLKVKNFEFIFKKYKFNITKINKLTIMFPPGKMDGKLFSKGTTTFELEKN